VKAEYLKTIIFIILNWDILNGMYLKFEKQESILITALSGELDHNSAEEVRVRIDDRIDRDNIEKVILDFSGVTFMDSSGIGAVLGRYKKLVNKNGVLCIAEPNKNVNRIFELAGLYKVIKNYNTVDEAVRNI
jgi:stage II sporulation protein AA (anti-sigma F factor antagonist)